MVFLIGAKWWVFRVFHKREGPETREVPEGPETRERATNTPGRARPGLIGTIRIQSVPDRVHTGLHNLHTHISYRGKSPFRV